MLGFHAYKSVAPLKLSMVKPVEAMRDRFPRLQKRGPIEAISESDLTPPVKLFPRLQKRGPIEATSATTTHAGFGLFPRLQKRGPIEAERCSSVPSS